MYYTNIPPIAPITSVYFINGCIDRQMEEGAIATHNGVASLSGCKFMFVRKAGSAGDAHDNNAHLDGTQKM